MGGEKGALEDKRTRVKRIRVIEVFFIVVYF